MRENLKAAIYHFTNGSLKRPIIYKKELERLESFAKTKGYEDLIVYLDKTMVISQQEQRKLMIENIDHFDALILKDFYHLKKNTGTCIEDLMMIDKKQIKVYTVEDGELIFESNPRYDKNLKVAIYYCGLENIERSLELQIDIMESYIRSKTIWTIEGKYIDAKGSKKNENQLALEKLIAERNNYDLVMVQSFADINWRMSQFCKRRHQLKLDIYSTSEGVCLRYKA